MNVRETLTEKPFLAIALASVLLLAGVALFVFQLRGSGAPTTGERSAFFSVDDGKTWFSDDARKVPPFDKAGKQAVLAHVYRAPDGTKFVNHLERFKPESKQAIEAANRATPQSSGRADRSAAQSAYIGGREVKRPGDANWVNAANFREAAQVTSIKCPNGGTQATPVEP
jgi:hypothetical protein